MYVCMKFLVVSSTLYKVMHDNEELLSSFQVNMNYSDQVVVDGGGLTHILHTHLTSQQRMSQYCKPGSYYQ